MRFRITLVAVVLAAWPIHTPAQVARITAAEYQARRAALAKAIGPDAVFMASRRRSPPRRRAPRRISKR